MTTLATSGIVQSYQTETQREKEDQLLFVGERYMQAIASYYNSFPAGSKRRLPRSLEELLNDERFATPAHHLRRLYPDPMTGRADWQLVLADGGIVGVHSQSAAEPLKKSGFAVRFKLFENSATYAQWVFAIKLQ